MACDKFEKGTPAYIECIKDTGAKDPKAENVDKTPRREPGRMKPGPMPKYWPIQDIKGKGKKREFPKGSHRTPYFDLDDD